MGKYLGTINHNEPKDIETAYFVPSWHDEEVISQSVGIAPLKNNEVSVIFSKQYREFSSTFCHFIFTKEETDIIINALLEAKSRWIENRVFEE
jgi:hypothetical protein